MLSISCCYLSQHECGLSCLALCCYFYLKIHPLIVGNFSFEGDKLLLLLRSYLSFPAPGAGASEHLCLFLLVTAVIMRDRKPWGLCRGTLGGLQSALPCDGRGLAGRYRVCHSLCTLELVSFCSQGFGNN